MKNIKVVKNILAKTIFLTPVLFVVLMAGSQSACCKKEEVKPAVVPDSGSVVFWQTSTTRNKYKSMSVAHYFYYVGGKKVGEMYHDNYWAVAPDCGADIAVTAKLPMEGQATKVLQLQVRTNTGDLLIDDNITLKSNQCIAYEVK